MPSVDTIPASGTATIAAAQAINSRVFIVRTTNWDQFGPPPASLAAVSLRTQCAIPVNALGRVFFHVFQYPEYDRGDQVFRARNTLEWRPVFQSPPDNHLGVTGLTTADWLPVTSPMLMLPGVPILREFDCAGFYMASVEVRAGAAGANQGEDRVSITISGTM